VFGHAVILPGAGGDGNDRADLARVRYPDRQLETPGAHDMSYPTPGGWPDPSTPQPDPSAAPLPGTAPAYPPPPGYDPGAYPPAGYDPVAYPAQYPGYPPYGYPSPRPTNGMAVAAMVCSLTGLLTFFSAPVGAILGHVARRQIRERGEEGDGMALAGIIVGWVITGLGVLGCGLYILFMVALFGTSSSGSL
jgi:hypothetical protein